MNMLEADLDMQNVRTNIVTIIYVEPPSDDQLLSQALAELDGSAGRGYSHEQMDALTSLKSRFFSRSISCIGKVVPNKTRDHDTLVFEVILPADLEDEENLQQACEIVAPLLILSQQVVIDL